MPIVCSSVVCRVWSVLCALVLCALVLCALVLCALVLYAESGVFCCPVLAPQLQEWLQDQRDGPRHQCWWDLGGIHTCTVMYNYYYTNVVSLSLFCVCVCVCVCRNSTVCWARLSRETMGTLVTSHCSSQPAPQPAPQPLHDIMSIPQASTSRTLRSRPLVRGCSGGTAVVPLSPCSPRRWRCGL